MTFLLVRWFLNAIALLIVAQIVPGFSISSVGAALVAALILGLLNATVRPLLLLLTLPITIVTLGLFTLIINGLIISLLAFIVKGVEVQSFSAAILAGIVLWLISWITAWFLNAEAAPVR